MISIVAKLSIGLSAITAFFFFGDLLRGAFVVCGA